MAQKLLIHEQRERRSRAKDILYLHDTIELLGAALDVPQRDFSPAPGDGWDDTLPPSTAPTNLQSTMFPGQPGCP